jgi:Fungal chitosanase of glycosyl hydrolase group 75
MATRIGNAVCWRSGMAVDADGSPSAYNPLGGGDDALGNAGHAGNWFGVVTDNGQPSGNPIVQGAYDPKPGYYISQTALVDRTKAVTDPRRYVDSTSAPYVSIPSDALASRGGELHIGDLAMVCYGALRCAAVVADVGPKNHWGEGSIALAKALGIPPSPRNGGVPSGVTFLVFPGTAATPPWPRAADDIKNAAEDLFTAFGGMPALSNIP